MQKAWNKILGLTLLPLSRNQWPCSIHYIYHRIPFLFNTDIDISSLVYLQVILRVSVCMCVCINEWCTLKIQAKLKGKGWGKKSLSLAWQWLINCIKRLSAHTLQCLSPDVLITSRAHWEGSFTTVVLGQESIVESNTAGPPYLRSNEI